MLSRNNFFILMTIELILSVFVTDVMGVNLIKYTEDKDGTLNYYDKDSIKRKSGIVRVWTKMKFKERSEVWNSWVYWKKNKGWNSWVDICKNYPERVTNINDCDNLSYVKDLYEINCKKDRQRRLSSIIYDDYGKVLFSNLTPTEWIDIFPNLVFEKLKNQVCK